MSVFTSNPQKKANNCILPVITRIQIIPSLLKSQLDIEI